MGIEEEIAKGRSRYLVNPGNITRFPEEDIPYKMLLNFKEYVYSSTTATSALIDQQNNISLMDNGSVILPLPLQLNDNTNIDATPTSSVFSNFISSILENPTAFNKVNMTDLGLNEIQAYSNLVKSTGALGNMAGKVLGSGAASTLSAIGQAGLSDTAALLNGKAVNPFETMQFKGVKLRNHSFSWKLSPSSQKDSDNLRNIINKIKGNILPSYVGVAGPEQFGSHALLKYPAIAMVSFYGINQDYYYKLKPSMITSFNVKYNGSEQLNIYRGGKPVIVELSMDLTELSIHTSDDYGGYTYTDVANPEYTANTIINTTTNVVDYLMGTDDSNGGPS